MNKHSESNTRHGAGKTDGIDPKTGEHEVTHNPYEPGSTPGPVQPQTEPTDPQPNQDPETNELRTAALQQEALRSTCAVKQGTQQFMGYSQAITAVTSEVIQRYFTALERNTQRYCHAVSAYLDAFREELNTPKREYDEDDAVRQASPVPYSHRSRFDSGRNDGVAKSSHS